MRFSVGEQIEAPEVVVDGQDVDATEARVGRVRADGVRADDGARGRRVLVEVRDRYAVQDAEAVVESLDLIARSREAIRDAFVGDNDASAVGEARAETAQRVDGVVHVVQRL